MREEDGTKAGEGTMREGAEAVPAPKVRRPGFRRPPRLAGDLLGQALRDAAPNASVAVLSLCGAWERVVGPSRAAVVRPASLEDGVLWLRSSDYAAKTEIRFSEDEIVSRANEVLGLPLVRRIRFRA